MVDRAMEPPDAAANVTAFLVVTADAFAVPAAPGSPVCSFRYRVTPDRADPR
jgi:hypothetical protein